MDESAIGEPKTLRNAVLGAIVTVLLSFTAVSPLLGGALAGYLQREPPKQGVKVGAISGAIAIVPFFVVVFLGMVLVGMAGARTGLPGGMELAIILFVIFPLLAAWNVGLSAAGGYVGASIRQGSRPPTAETAPPEQGA